MKSIIFAMGAIFMASSAFGGVFERMNPGQQSQILAGEIVFLTVPVEGKPWPKALAYLKIDASPEQSAAVFSDFESQAQYIPNLNYSKISETLDRKTYRVDYELNLPFPLKDEWYTVEDRLARYEGDTGYRVDWNLVRARTTVATEGYAVFERLPDGSTFMLYSNFVEPGSALAGLAKGKAMAQVRDTAAAIRSHVESTARGNGGQMEQLLQTLRWRMAD